MTDATEHRAAKVCGICGQRHEDGQEVDALAMFLNRLFAAGLPEQSAWNHHTADDKDAWRHDARAVLAEVKRLTE